MMDPGSNEGNRFRQPPTGTAPPPLQQGLNQAQHPQQAGMTAVPLSTTHTWNFRYQSNMDGKIYEGQFSCKKLSIMELSRLGVRKVQLNGGFHYDENKPGQGVEEHIDSMNAMLAHLELAIIQAPVWFNPEYMYDPELLQAIYTEVVTFENSFFRPQRSAPEPGRGIPDDRSREGEESGTAGRATAVGREQVSASLDP